MTYLTQDLSPDDGAPYETFEFSLPGSSTAWRYTNSRVDVGDFVAVPIHRGPITQDGGSIGARTSIEVADDNPLALALNAGLTSRPIEVVVRRYHRTDAALEAAVVFKGLVTGVSFEGAQATLPCASRFALASRRRVPWLTYQAGCNLEWGSARCGVDKASYALTATVAADDMTGRVLSVPAADSYDNGFFSGGWVERANGDRRFIDSHTGALLQLQMPWGDLAAGGETVTVYPGCQRTEAYCASVFNNLVNYLGWPRLPSINPFSRSAYYQGGVADIPDPGDTWELPDGYALVLSDQTVTVDQSDTPVVHSDISALQIQIQFFPNGYAYIRTFSTALGNTTTVLTGGVWINPKNPPASAPESLDIYIEPPVTSVSTGSLSGFNTWQDAGGTVTAIFTYYPSDLSTGLTTHEFELGVSARDKAVGLVRAACTFTVRHRVQISFTFGE